MENRGSNIPQQGNNNLTKVEGDRVLKTPNSSSTFMLEQSYEQQVKQWNKYYAGTPYATAVITEDGKLSTPFIKGSYPNDQQRLAICEEMKKKGFIMVDCRDKRNFLVNEDGIVCPVDFGQMYTSENRLYKVHLRVVDKEMDRIRAQIANPRKSSVFEDLSLSPQAQPAHTPMPSVMRPAANATPSSTSSQDADAFQAVEIYIDSLLDYKSTLQKDAKDPIIQDKIATIDSFIADTRTRIQKFQSGDKNAFDGYIDANKAALAVFAKNRMTRPIMFSILLSLMVIPAIVGAIQMAITKGNTFLFVTAIKESEKRALNLQNKVVEVKETLFSEKKSLKESEPNPAKESDNGYEM